MRIKRIIKTMVPIMAVLAVFGFAFSLLSGDGCGPVERGIRAGLGTWDMWETAMVAPYQRPMGAVPDGVVPVGGRSDTYEAAQTALKAISADERIKRAHLNYRRFCHHCHGPNGDNRIIVGESFGFKLPDLRSDEIQNLADVQIFEALSLGSERMIPLAATISPVDRLLVIEYLRTLKGRPSRPFYPPRWVEPAEQPGGPSGR
jgi:hypothetical protein